MVKMGCDEKGMFRGVCSWGCVQGAVSKGLCGRHTEVGGTHPTVTHSCYHMGTVSQWRKKPKIHQMWWFA